MTSRKIRSGPWSERSGRAARPKGIHFHMLHRKDLSRVKEVLYCTEEDKPVTRSEIVKGTEGAKGEYVVVTDEELKKIAPPTATTMEILQFVHSGDVDPIFFDSSYYVAPEEAVSKPYMLLMRAMNETKYYAVAKITMHGREHIVIIRPATSGLVLQTIYFVNELQKANAPKISKNGSFSAKETEFAKTLVNKLAGDFEPEQYHDEYVENVQRLLEQKRRGQKTTPVSQPKTRPVLNIMDALRRSLAEGQKSRPRSRPQKSRRRSEG